MASTVELTMVNGQLGLQLPAELVQQFQLKAGQSLQLDFDQTNTLTLQDH